jgi:8-oxo-dGTP pyrophosphatase MutT (NUDIX family)
MNKSAGVTPFRYNQGRLEVLVCIGIGGAQHNKILSFGGSIEHGETSDVAAVRELYEESGMLLNGNPVAQDSISPCIHTLFPQTAGTHQFFHYYIMIHPSDVVSFVIPSHQEESKAVDKIAGITTEPIKGTMQRSRVAWVPVDILLGRADVFENFQEVLFLQFQDMPQSAISTMSSVASPSSSTVGYKECVKCTYQNSSDKTKCDLCDYTFPELSFMPPAAAASSVEATENKACPICTYINSSDKTRCEICGFEFPIIKPAVAQAFAHMLHSNLGKEGKKARKKTSKKARKKTSKKARKKLSKRKSRK